MDIMAALDEMRSLNARHAGISNADALNAMTANMRTDEERYAGTMYCRYRGRDREAKSRTGLTFVSNSSARRADELDAETARAIFKEQRAKIVNRVQSESESDDDDGNAAKKPRLDAHAVSVVVKRPTNLVVKSKAKSNVVATAKVESSPPAGIEGLFGDYGSDTD
jgi:hypothetical protein